MKVHATVAVPYRATETDAPVFRVDYVFTSGALRSDTVGLTIGAYYNEVSMLYQLKQALVVHLQSKYTPETFRTSDIVLF